MWIVALLLMLWPWGVEGWLLVQQQATPTAGLVERGNAIIRRGEPEVGESATEPLKRATETATRVTQKAQEAELPNGEQYVLWFGEITGSDSRPPEVRSEGRPHAIAALEEMRKQGVFDAVLEAGRAPRDVVWLIKEPGKQFEQEVALGALRQIVRANSARQVLAAEAGDWDEYVSAVECTLVIGRLSGRSGAILNRLVGLAAVTMPLERVLVDIGTRDVPGEVLDRLSAVFERERMTPPDATIDLIGVDLELTAAQLFTDGPTGGRPIYSKFRMSFEFIRAIQRFLGEYEGSWFDWLPEDAAWNLTGLVMASRAETLRVLRHAYDEFRTNTALARPERRLRVKMPLPKGVRHTYTRILEDLCFGAYEKWWDTEEATAFRLDGARLVLAVERYRDRHAGQAPQRLEALVPEYVASLPRDPISGKPLVYRVLDAAADPQGRSYVLYSVGGDGIDNGGEYDPMRNQSSLMGPATASGHDYVFSVPPTWREEKR
ncbi:MAG TPA: hypothetical protein VD997_09175 [Phycisphaerales bacterium]|nr:hypothetical protein [Phycisphaerales bacterium]